MEEELFDAGWIAYCKGYNRTECPEDDEWRKGQWLRGWNAACFNVGDLYD